MGKLAIIGKLALARMPASVVKILAPKRDIYRGEMIDPKAYALGQLANEIRGEGATATVAESRVQMAKTAALFDRKGPAVARVENISVQGAAGPIKARLYSDQADRSHKLPALVFYHGGGFIQGDLDTHNETCLKIAKWWGGVVIAVAYRLAPEHPFPAGPDDCTAAFVDIIGRAEEFGIIADKTGVGGDSAGGCFAAVTAQQLKIIGGPMPNFQVLIYPVTDGHMATASIDELCDAYVLPKQRMTWYRDQYAAGFDDFDDVKFSPAQSNDLKNLPQSYIITGGFDPLVDDGIGYAKILARAGVQVTHRHFPGQIHAFINLTKIIPEGTQAIEEVAAWLRKICAP